MAYPPENLRNPRGTELQAKTRDDDLLVDTQHSLPALWMVSGKGRLRQ